MQTGSISETAASLTKARTRAEALAAFPGAMPADLDTAYAIQTAATTLWAEDIGGWKVGRIMGALQSALGADRFLGPIFAPGIRRTVPGEACPFPVPPGGFAALEAEFVLEIGRDAPADLRSWTPDAARAYVRRVHIGIEVAGSPLTPINDLGPLVSIAAFGNNIGLILGPAVPEWQDGAFETTLCTTWINGQRTGQAAATNLPGGPHAALAFAFEQAARLGRPLRAGDLISTGAVTGVHPIRLGQSCSADFGPLGRLDCVTVPMAPRPATQSR